MAPLNRRPQGNWDDKKPKAAAIFTHSVALPTKPGNPLGSRSLELNGGFAGKKVVTNRAGVAPSARLRCTSATAPPNGYLPLFPGHADEGVLPTNSRRMFRDTGPCSPGLDKSPIATPRRGGGRVRTCASS